METNILAAAMFFAFGCFFLLLVFVGIASIVDAINKRNNYD